MTKESHADEQKTKTTAQNANYPTRSLHFLSALQQKPTETNNTATSTPPPAAPSPPTSTTTEECPAPAPAPNAPALNTILIIGAGICGLSTAIALTLHLKQKNNNNNNNNKTTTPTKTPTPTTPKIKIIEQSPHLSEIGAGVQIPPNATRLLLRWGVRPHLEKHVVEPEASVFRRWRDGAVVGRAVLMPEVGEWFGGGGSTAADGGDGDGAECSASGLRGEGGGAGVGVGEGEGEGKGMGKRSDAPYWVVHRADYQAALYERARELGVEVMFGRRVVGVDEGRGAVRWVGGGEAGRAEEGEEVADLVVAADGIFSEGRKAVLGDRDQPPVLTGLAAYRATIPAEKIRSDPDTAWMLDNYIQNGWLGPSRHVVTYTITGGAAVNVVLIHPEPSDPSTWKQETALTDMKEQFVGWERSVTKLISLITSTLKWPMMAGQALERWVSESNKVVIIGDAAHAMLPFMSQGAAQAVEDAASLATLISSISSKSELPTALRVFEELRIVRTAQVQQASFVNGRIFHFPDGPEQRARDEAMRAEADGKHYIQSPNGLSDPTTQIWLYSHDAEDEAGRAWEQETRKRSKL
ncbi:salicylate hydroxylase [Diplodia corticola]|uniref:Salicylate hydroxylase n=1 Tax=Diplodia corticola TaxID=236234 RepID=A0A1J9R8P8_9PEZI|nr:salicylate hydroxylase [Diplodia corticola]OJD36897.1 salicylate hydroxylase [Diplodia corticola]